MRRFTRGEILERLAGARARGEPIVLGGAGIGLVAKAADRAGIDVLMAYNTGPFRMDGHGSLAGYLAYGDANAITLELGRKLLPELAQLPAGHIFDGEIVASREDSLARRPRCRSRPGHQASSA
jgi:predicted TIM-barrel enzyme